MNKILIGILAFLSLLVGCGQKKDSGISTTENSQEALQSTLPVLENATKNTVVTKTLVLPVAEHGLEEAKKALKEAEDKDESVQETRKFTGFSLESTLLSETEMETKTSYDFQVMDIKKASEDEYFKNIGLENLLKYEPEEYIENRVASGATVQ